MTSAIPDAWRCTVCGYVHQGPEPPEVCPVCGAPASEFEPYAEPAAQPSAAPPNRWRCLNCSYIHEGPAPPGTCPLCGAPSDRFEPLPAAEAPAAGEGEPARVVIVGAGIAGVSAAEAVRQTSTASPVTLVSSEAALPYYRLNLTRYLSGEVTRDALPIHPETWYAENDIDLLPSTGVESVSPDGKSVRLTDGRELAYDRLILAMGSHPFVPPIPGTELDGVMTLRTAEDADRILAEARAGRRCVCVGGGILGIETAGALARQGVEVTLLESHQWLMPRQLNRQAGERLARHMEGIGVGLRHNARSREIEGQGRVSGVALQSGETVPAGLVVITTGVRANTHVARKAGIEVNRGIVVDNHLRTSAPDVFAAGDVAEHNGQLYGAWSASQYQGSIAGLNAAGVVTPFGGIPRSNSLKVLGLDMLSVGQFEPEDGSFLVLQQDVHAGLFHFVFRDGRLVGSILLGDAAIGPGVRKAIETGEDFSRLLAGTPTAAAIIRHFAASG